MKNGSLFKSPDGKVVLLQHLHNDVFCLLEVANGELLVINEGKWKYPEAELQDRLNGFTEIKGSHISVVTAIAPPRQTRKATASSAPSKQTRKKK
jgi:hypothetical protein